MDTATLPRPAARRGLPRRRGGAGQAVERARRAASPTGETGLRDAVRALSADGSRRTPPLCPHRSPTRSPGSRPSCARPSAPDVRRGRPWGRGHRGTPGQRAARRRDRRPRGRPAGAADPGPLGRAAAARGGRAAGMSPHCDFTEQLSIDRRRRPARPDLVVHLAGGKSVVVDAKVSLAAYLEAHETTDEAAAPTAWRPTPVICVRTSTSSPPRPTGPGSPGAGVRRALPAWRGVPRPGPRGDPALLEHAFARRVHLATPTTLISLLRTVAYTWQQQALADGAQEVLDLGKELHARLAVFGGHVDKVGRSLARPSAPTTPRSARWRAGCSSQPAGSVSCRSSTPSLAAPATVAELPRLRPGARAHRWLGGDRLTGRRAVRRGVADAAPRGVNLGTGHPHARSNAVTAPDRPTTPVDRTRPAASAPRAGAPRRTAGTPRRRRPGADGGRGGGVAMGSASSAR